VWNYVTCGSFLPLQWDGNRFLQGEHVQEGIAPPIVQDDKAKLLVGIEPAHTVSG